MAPVPGDITGGLISAKRLLFNCLANPALPFTPLISCSGSDSNDCVVCGCITSLKASNVFTCNDLEAKREDDIRFVERLTVTGTVETWQQV
jgi:hypothetical protein